MQTSNFRDFAQGLAAGLIAALAAVLLLVTIADSGAGLTLPNWPATANAAEWLARNLGLSLPVFALVLLLFVFSLAKLHRLLLRNGPVADIAHADQLTDIWTSLFFGVGVIWTAVGMRGALIHALGDADATLAGGAFQVLQKMVDGGILLALSTTIFGGAGGYLLRVVKAVTVSSRLRQCYEEAAAASTRNVEASLESIDARLRRIVQRFPEAAE